MPHNESETKVLTYLSLGFALLGVISTIAGTWERFGLTGALFAAAIISTLVLLSCFFWKSSSSVCQSVRKCITSYLPQHKTLRFFARLTALLWLLTFASYLTGIGNAYLWRSDYSLDHSSLQIEKAEFGSNYFEPTHSLELGTQQAREREAMTPWLRWMAAGGGHDEPSGERDERQQPILDEYSLIYIESEQFHSRYKTIHCSLSVAESLAIDDGCAFLVSGLDEAPWWKGTWRQMSVLKTASEKSLDVIATCPNSGERLIVFLRVRVNKGQAMPPKDRLIHKDEFEVHR